MDGVAVPVVVCGVPGVLPCGVALVFAFVEDGDDAVGNSDDER